MKASLLVTAAPHLAPRVSMPRIMWTVVASLLPVVAASAWFFGVSALLVVAASSLGAVLTERAFGGKGTLADGSALITGILLGLTLPAGVPLWMAALGAGFAIGFGKLCFGGLGFNPFNPALLGRAFLQAAFPVALTTWPAPGGSWWTLRGDHFALPFLRGHPVDAITAATPLGLLKFEARPTPLRDLVLGATGGSLGETAAIVILLCGAYLALRGYLNWRIPAAIFASVALFATVLHRLDAARYPGALFMLFSGGLMLGAVFMATDLVTAPITNRGRWIFGSGIGVLIVVIRMWGGLSEGVMYAILLMNALVPLINRATRPRQFGAQPAKAVKELTA